MSTVPMVISGLLLGMIAWQDFHERAVSAWLLGLLAMAELMMGYLRTGIESSLRNFTQNSIITFSLIAVVWLYLIVKNRKWMNLFKECFGSADLILLLILGIVFSPFIFVLFMLAGFMLALSITLLIRQVVKIREQTIPLATYLSVLAILVLSFNVIFPQVRLDEDSWLILFINIYQ